MTVFVALLRAVNVGGTGMLPMKDLAGLCTKLGLENVRTYIQTGNVVFASRLSGPAFGESLEKALEAHMGKKVDVILRDAAELRQVLKANPFPDAAPLPSGRGVLFGARCRKSSSTPSSSRRTSRSSSAIRSSTSTIRTAWVDRS